MLSNYIFPIRLQIHQICCLSLIQVKNNFFVAKLLELNMKDEQ